MSAPLKKKGERRDYDVYETPEWAVQALLDVIPINPSWTYLEPCRASGRFYNHMPLGSAWGEIREGVDYLNTYYPNHVDCIITNPPYSLAQEFVTKALDDADVVIMLLRLGFLESMKRWEWWQENPITSLMVLSQRPSFTEDGKTDGSGYAYFIWDRKNRLNLKPFYFLEGQDDECRKQDARDRRNRKRSNPARDEPAVRQHGGGDSPMCQEGTFGDGDGDRSAGLPA